MRLSQSTHRRSDYLGTYTSAHRHHSHASIASLLRDDIAFFGRSLIRLVCRLHRVVGPRALAIGLVRDSTWIRSSTNSWCDRHPNTIRGLVFGGSLTALLLLLHFAARLDLLRLLLGMTLSILGPPVILTCLALWIPWQVWVRISFATHPLNKATCLISFHTLFLLWSIYNSFHLRFALCTTLILLATLIGMRLARFQVWITALYCLQMFFPPPGFFDRFARQGRNGFFS